MVCVEKEHIGFNSHATTAITTDQMLFDFQRHNKSIRQMELNAFYVICTLLRFQNCHEALETQSSQPMSKTMAAAANYIRKKSDVVGVARNGTATAAIIFLHGLGDTGHGWSSLIDEIRPPFMSYNCPTANTIPVSLNMGFQMPSWFNIFSLELDGPEDEEGIKAAAADVHGMINNEIKAGIPAERIILGGFSQGGALALYSALTFPERLGGVVGLSCWLPLHASFPAAKTSPDTTPVLLCHGDSDPIVGYKFGQLSHSLMKKYFKTIQFKTYQGLAHQSSPEEIRDIKDFINQQIPHP